MIIRHPAAPLPGSKPDNPSLAERFELYIAGIELCNAFTELTDPVEQRKRFEEERRFRRQAGKLNTPCRESFLSALSDIPAASGEMRLEKWIDSFFF